MRLLTKSDFIIARSCETKLYYKMLRYPSVLDDGSYLQFLVDGGYMVEKMAKLLFPQGRTLGQFDALELAFAELKRELQAGDGTFFEATVIHDNLLARIDILQKSTTNLTVIEVKSGSFEWRDDALNPFRGNRGDILADYREYLEDLTFQCVVLRRAFPHFTIIPMLCLVDKSKAATKNSTFDKFQLRASTHSNRRSSMKVDYLGDVDRLAEEHVLAFLDATIEIADLQMELSSAVDKFAQTLLSDPIQ